MYAGAFAASRRSPSRTYQHAQPQQGNSRASRQQHSWLQSSVARRLLAESQFAKRPSTEPTSNDERGSAPRARGADGWPDHNAPHEGPGITAEGRYLPSSKAKYEAANAALQRRRSMGGQKFYSNYTNGYHDESGFDHYTSQQVPITAWNQPGASEFRARAHERGYSLPDNVTLVTLEEIENGDVLLRLAHLYEAGEHRELSKPAYIDIRLLFQGCQITSACEMDLSATQFKGNLPDLVIELRPMQVRTFLLTIT
ncbi:unnamed protein product [Calypogeia fissa]